MAMSTKKDPLAVAGVADPGSQNGAEETAVCGRRDNLPNSHKIYVGGEQYVDLRVPFREISLAPTKDFDGRLETNEPVRVYDTSGPWSDPDFHGDVQQGLPALREKWIRARGDVEEYDGRKIQPIDDGYLSGKHAAEAAARFGRAPSHAALVRAAGDHHTRDGVYCDPGEWATSPLENRKSRIENRSERITNHESRFTRLPAPTTRRRKLRRVHPARDHPGIRP